MPMADFIDALLAHRFLQMAVLTGVAASIACGVIGSYVVARRISYIAGGVAHSVLGGMGAAYYLQKVHGWEWLHPLHGAIVCALLAAAIIAYVTLRVHEREDTVISAIWAFGMAAGLLFIGRTPGYSEDLMSYLFGYLLLASGQDLGMIVALDVIIVGIGLLCYNQLQAVCFDEEFARLRGIRVGFYYVLLLCLVALTVVVLVTVVGLIMVIAMLTLPVAVAGHLANRLWHIMIVASVLCALFATLGVATSYVANLPTGATTILLVGGAYLLVVVARRFIGPKAA